MDDKDRKVEESLRNSFRDGVFASAMTGLTQDYFTPFILLLGGTARHVAMLSALPNLVSSLIQLKVADFSEKLKSRKKVINSFVFLQALTLLPMVFIAVTKSASPFYFIFCVVLFTSFGALAVPAWGSLMSDLVDRERRGAYFGWRNRVLGFIYVGTAFMAGFILNSFRVTGVFRGFIIILAAAFVSRLISWYFLERMYEPPLDYKDEDHFTFFDFIGRAKESNFAKFVIFVAMLSFSVNMAAPFFSVLMLRDLGFDYLTYTVIIIAAPLTVYLMMGRWGRHADKVGNLKVIKVTSRFIAFIPLLWVVNRHPVFLVFAQLFSGFAWAGFNISAANFIYDAVRPEKRTRCIAYFNSVNGLALCLGALVGGFILKGLPPLAGHSILTLLVISSILRIPVAFTMAGMVKEVRPVTKVRSNSLFLSVIGVRPLSGLDRDFDMGDRP